MVTRVSGMASGMDIESIVKGLMTAERVPLDKLKQQKQTLEWQRDDYRAMNTLLLDFRTELTQMKLTTQYRSRTVTSSDEAKVTATASSAASQGSYSISKVNQLAKAENWVTTDLSSNASFDSSKSLETQKGYFAGAWNWSQGAVGSQTLTGDGGKTLSLTLNTADGEVIPTADPTPPEIGAYKKMSVKVNGTAYEVVNTGTPTANQVVISNTGELTFGSNIASGAVVKVDYVTDQRVQKSTLSAAVKTFQLDKKDILEADFSLEVGGTSYSISSTAIDPVNGQKTGTLTNGGATLGTVNLTTGLVTFNSEKAVGTEIKAKFKQNYADFSINTHTSDGAVTERFLIQSSESMNQVINRVNNSDAGVSMFFDTATKKMSMMRTETGDFNETAYDPITNTSATRESDIAISSFSGFSENALKLTSASATITHGEKAVFTINGLETTRDLNIFDMNGVTITLKQTFDSANAGVTAANLSINNDGNAVFDNVKAFVEKYNTLIAAISAKTSEEKFRSYTPLTDDQREQLSDKQQEQWEEKAKSGLLRRDTTLTSVLSSMRSNFSQPVSNSDVDPMMKQLASIGITTTANYLEGGKLEINEAKLKEAINNNPEAVEALFRGGSDDSPLSEQGIARRLYNTVNETMDKLKERAGNSFSTNQQFTLGKQLSDVENRITRFEDRLTQVEDRYWRQFTAMEQAIQQANSQSAYLMQQFSSF